MVKNQQPINIDINQAVVLRHEAAGLLRRLEENRQAAELICAAVNKPDGMRTVTGRSAIECAIETTRGMIREMDHLLEEAADTYGGVNGDFESNRAPRELRERRAHLAEHLVESR